MRGDIVFTTDSKHRIITFDWIVSQRTRSSGLPMTGEKRPADLTQSRQVLKDPKLRPGDISSHTRVLDCADENLLRSRQFTSLQEPPVMIFLHSEKDSEQTAPRKAELRHTVAAILKRILRQLDHTRGTRMGRLVATLGASVVALGTLMGSVQAKTVFYEINGERYSYDTNNRKQAAAARKQIEAAQAVEAARAKAAAERASNPLVAVFGSQTQREATEAQAQLEKVLSDQQQAAAASKDQHSSQLTTDEGVARPAKGNAGKAAETTQDQQITTVATVAAPSATPNLGASDEPVRTDDARRAAVKSMFFDAETGIKTIIRMDGSMQEESFDPGILSKLDSEQHSTNSVSSAVGTDQLSKTAPEDTTGSTRFRGATLEPGSRSEVRGRPLTN